MGTPCHYIEVPTIFTLMASYLFTHSLSRFAPRETIVQLVETFNLHPYMAMYSWRIFQSWILKFLKYWNFSILSITFLTYIFTLWCCWDFDRARRDESFNIQYCQVWNMKNFDVYFAHTFSTGTFEGAQLRTGRSPRMGTTIFVIRASNSSGECVIFPDFEEKILHVSLR